ncbi:hypothetical protein VCHA43P273_60223 [Vibrio chagasii]|nr:hypothetical protein VCHA43P273_60223 [Vibrio chagasii]CAK1746240.1 hypothetical protein VCRA2113O354_130031 [Vibrio crassostreae]CAK1755968.1 hypothetical protein VCRA2114O369_130118 [Vibrio crassostreae]CAK2264652.1 hypothetical protein VCRA2114O368_120031 [Vibrio crassostreae]CAK2282065.1 hypothetical protein VCRA2113O355_120031 [Vibrio crassostreae]
MLMIAREVQRALLEALERLIEHRGNKAKARSALEIQYLKRKNDRHSSN